MRARGYFRRKEIADVGDGRAAFREALARAPSSEEKANLAAYAQQHGLANACRVIFNLNEFAFVD